MLSERALLDLEVAPAKASHRYNPAEAGQPNGIPDFAADKRKDRFAETWANRSRKHLDSVEGSLHTARERCSAKWTKNLDLRYYENEGGSPRNRKGF